MDHWLLNSRTAGVGDTDCGLDECSKGEFGLVACGDLISRGSLALGSIPTATKFGCKLHGAICCPLFLTVCLVSALLANNVDSGSGLASLGLFAIFSDFGLIFETGSVTGGYELDELIFVQLFLISVVVLDAVKLLFIIKSENGAGELRVSKHF